MGVVCEGGHVLRLGRSNSSQDCTSHRRTPLMAPEPRATELLFVNEQVCFDLLCILDNLSNKVCCSIAKGLLTNSSDPSTIIPSFPS